MSVEEYQRLIRGGSGDGTESTKTSYNKYRNTRVYCYANGIVSSGIKLPDYGQPVQEYASEKEHRRHCELILLERAGRISALETQKPLVVAEGFTDSNGKTHRPIIYKADFFYIENGKSVVEDVKGYDKISGRHLMTQVFRIKWKLLQAKYYQYDFRIY